MITVMLHSLQAVFPAKNNNLHWGNLYGCSHALLIAKTALEFKGVSLFVIADMNSAYQAQSDIRFFSANRLDVSIFPDWETLPYDLFSPLEDIISERLKRLYQLPQTQQAVVIVPINTLMQRIAPPDYVNTHALVLNTGDCLDINLLREHLQEAGYRSVSQVIQHGEYATRGSLLDLFPMGSDVPYRIDFFDDEIETIRSFSSEDQRTIEQLKQIELLPANEFALDEKSIRLFRQNYRRCISGDATKSLIYQSITNAQTPAGIEYYLPLFFEKTACLLDYLPDKHLVFIAENIDTAIDSYWAMINDRYEQRRHDIERPILAPDEIWLNPQEIQQRLNAYRRILLQRKKYSVKDDVIKNPASLELAHNFNTSPLPSLLIQTGAVQPLLQLQQFLAVHKGKVLFTSHSAGRRENLLGLLKEHSIPCHSVENWSDFLKQGQKRAITLAPLQQGLWLEQDQLAIIPESLILGIKIEQQRRKKSRDSDAIIRNLTDLSEGSPVVHEEHGIGRYLGMQTLKTGDFEAEYLMLEYANKDKLYVPVASLHLISRYTGVSDKAPLHRLGTEHWDKIRKKAAEKAYDVAAELLEIHAKRAAIQGEAIPINEAEYALFADAFPFEETPDQAAAIAQTLRDMHTGKPMDRVVCGDVGFGKTEVAMRAAFIAANATKQVAMIAPTTLLVEQHLQNFQDRFADWPFLIESLSRFKTPKQTKEALAKLASGHINIVIGTHKLLQADVKFHNLGLVIVDEEHRFGVRHKEQLKKLRSNVDMLTLTATPIPRTLNMSLSGIRDLSIIATAPVQRHPIKTFVTEWNDSLVQEACERELSRGGQIYILHNEVKTINKMTQRIQALLPKTTVRFAHGQMRERELEAIIQDFYQQRFQVLVATTIIESGIDVPSANTIIINRADKLGLAQLHQIRGRVGRSHHRAYAYLITPPKNIMTKDAVKRLDAIESLEDLGVGFTLATHDLEIRGAGELLGEGQSGQIQEIGFNLYNELLQRAVKALKAGDIPDMDKPLAEHTSVEIGAPALIPTAYIPDVHSRLILYKRIASTENKSEIRALKVEMIDRFGLLPDEVNHLFAVTQLRQLAQTLGVKKLDVAAAGGRILFNQNNKVDPMKIFQLVQTRPWTYKLSGQDSIRFEKELEEVQQRVDWVTDLLQQITITD
jgi:transcription-repair coupling factor (superfamily II helicase)